MKRVAILAPSLDHTSGGVERFCSMLEDALSDVAEVRIFAPTRRASRWQARLGMEHLVAGRSGLQEIATWNPDLVITNGSLTGLARIRGRRIHVLHGTTPAAVAATPGLTFRDRARRVVSGSLGELVGCRSADVVVAVSASCAEEARRYFRQRRVVVIENAVDTDLFRERFREAARTELGLPLDRKLVLFAGRVEARKGGHLLADIAGSAGYELVIAGPSAVPGHLHLGSLEPERLAVAYAAADAVLFPTTYEACSFVVLEVLACGVPLVTTRVGWARDLDVRVPGYGTLLAAPTIEGMAARLRDLDESVLDPVKRAQALVRQANDVAAFARAWRGLVATSL